MFIYIIFVSYKNQLIKNTMKKITLQKLSIKNFKGITAFEFTPGMNTRIAGKNGTGKTSVFDAFTWLLYGKNSIDQKDFGIKTKEKTGEPIHQIDHSVEGVFLVDGKETILKRVYREKWSTRRGEATPEMVGHESVYFINEVPKSLGEFNKEVNELISESISKIITNPSYFNEKLSWNERREILTDMAGDINELAIAESLNLEEIIAMFNEGRNIEDQKRIVSAQRKKIKDEASAIPARIDEIHNSKPAAQDWESIKTQKQTKETELEKIESLISSEVEAVNALNKKRTEAQQKVFSIQSKINELTNIEKEKANGSKYEIENKIKDLRRQAADKIGDSDLLIQKNDLLNASISQTEKELERLRNDYFSINSSVFEFDEQEEVCPTCNHKIDKEAVNVEELKANFNAEKLKKLEDNKEKGQKTSLGLAELRTKISENQLIIDQNQKESEELLKQVETLTNETLRPVNIVDTKEILNLKAEVKTIVLPELKTADTNQLNEEKRALIGEIKALEALLYDKEAINKIDLRIEELKKEQAQFAQQLSDLEKIEFQIDKFNKLKIEAVESKVNNLFSLVKFKLFEDQINGGQAPTCECMIDGVPFNDLNTASKVNAGLDIINALNFHYETFAPVFIDGRESVTELLPVKSQIISLIVDPSANELTVLNV